VTNEIVILAKYSYKEATIYEIKVITKKIYFD